MTTEELIAAATLIDLSVTRIDESKLHYLARALLTRGEYDLWRECGTAPLGPESARCGPEEVVEPPFLPRWQPKKLWFAQMADLINKRGGT